MQILRNVLDISLSKTLKERAVLCVCQRSYEEYESTHTIDPTEMHTHAHVLQKTYAGLFPATSLIGTTQMSITNGTDN